MARKGSEHRGAGVDATGPDATGPNVSRRNFVAGVAVAGAAGAVSPHEAAQAAAMPSADIADAPARRPSALRPDARMAPRPRPARPRNSRRPQGPDGSDFMVDVIKTLNIDYVVLQSGVELPRAARVADRLRRQQEAGIHHLHARGILGRHGPWLLQGHRQAADDAVPRHRRSAARDHGDLQCLVRPRSRHRHRRHRYRCRLPGARRADLPFGPGHQRDRPRLTPSGTTSRCRCSISRSRSCAPTRSR